MIASEAKGPDSCRDVVEIAREVLRIEAEGLLHLVERIDDSFAVAVRWICEAEGRVIATGIGKSGIVARKIVATLSSTGTPSLFLHPVEAMHGDLGMARDGDIVLALSNSGETDELNVILPSLRNKGARIISFVGNTDSTLARHSDLAIYCGVPREACPLGLAPTASTTAMLAMGDALAVALIKKHNFQAGDFRRNHPGGKLGERLDAPICELMRTGEDIPIVREDALVTDALEEMHHKGLGATLVVGDGDRLLGIFTDGDLRRVLRASMDLAGKRMGDVMTKGCRTIRVERFVADGLEVMERHLITVLPVVDASDRLQGILHLHDLLGKGKIKFTR
jgi:arabinose-5-phosphate isomerase